MTFNDLSPEILCFFSKITATATHDLKNHLAIINENAGLLEDLSLLAEQGPALSPEKARTISGKVKKQVLRSDRVLKQLNHFAHYVNQGKEICDLETTIRLVLDLSTRLVEVKGIKIQVIPPKKPVQVSISPLICAFFIFRTIEVACELANKEITLSLDPDQLFFLLPGLKRGKIMSLPENLIHMMSDKGISVQNRQENSFALIWARPEL